MKKLVLLATVVVCSCSKPTRLGGLIADVRLSSGAKVSCADVRAKTTDGTELGQKLVAFKGKAEVQVGIGSDSYPRDIVISVRPLWSADGCTGAKPNGALLEKPAQFPLGGVTTITFDVSAPEASVDADHDGFAGVVAGGPDCNDTNAAQFPGATEDCLTLSDLDCDGLAGCGDTQCSAVSGCAQPPSQLQFTTPARTADTNACSAALTVESRDALGAVAALLPGSVVTLTASPAAGVRFFSDPTCTAEVTSLPVNAPTSTFTFYFSGAMSGMVEVTAATVTLTPAKQTQTVRPPGASVLAFATPERTVLSGACSMPVDIEARDGSGMPRMVAADVAVSLAVAPQGAVVFFSDAACTTGMELTSINIAAGQSKATLYVKGVTAGMPMVTAVATGFTPATQAVTVNAGAAAKLSFVTGPQGLAVNTCSAVAQVRAEDAAGNPATLGAPLMLTLMETGVAGFSFHGDMACGATLTTVPLAAAAGSLATFHFKGSAVGPAMLTVSGGSLTPATQTENIGVGPPAQLALSGGPYSVAAGACSPAVTVTLQDSAGNPVNPGMAVPVTLAGTPPSGFSVYSDMACATPLPLPLMLSGSPSATFRFRAQRTPSVRIDATSGSLMGANQTHTITGAPAASLAITTPQYSVVAGGCSPLVHVDVLDGFGNPIGVGNLQVTYASTAPMVAFRGSVAGCMTAAPMTVTSDAGFDFRFTGMTVGSAQLTVSSAGLDSGIQTHTITAGSAAQLAFTTNSRNQAAGACSPTPLTLQTQDLAGNAAPVTMGPLTVALSANDGGITFHDSAGCGNAPVSNITIANMTSSQNFWFVGRKVGLATVSATAGGFMPTKQDEDIGPGPANTLVITTPPRSTQVNTCSAEFVRWETRDQFGNVAPVSAQQFVSVDAGTNVMIFVGAACSAPQPSIAMNAGTSTALFHFRGATVGAFPVSLSLPGFTGDGDTLTITPAITKLAFTSGAMTKQAGECVALTVQARDASDVPQAPASPLAVALGAQPGFTYYSDAACTMAVTQVPVSSSAGTTFYFRGVTGSSVTLSATSGSLTQATVAVTIIPAVRTGTCTIASGNFNQTCGFSPPLFALNRTFLVFQAQPDNNTPEAASTLARCHLVDASNMHCERGGNPGSSTPLAVHWQTVTLPTAVNVQHFDDIVCAMNGENQTQMVSTLNGTGDVFALHSVAATGGNVDDNEHYMVNVSNNTTVTMNHSPNPDCTQGDTHDLQVVKLTGATVVRGTSQIAINTRTAGATGLASIATNRTMLLYSWRTDSLGDDSCERNVRGVVASNTTLGFSRAHTNMTTGCTNDSAVDIAYERVQLPVNWLVQTEDVTMANGTDTATATLTTAVDPTRTFLLTGSQTHGGSGLGETTLDTAQSPSHFSVDFALNAAGTQFVARRGSNAAGDVRYNVFIVQVDPR